jgi:hypothetical protein
MWGVRHETVKLAQLFLLLVYPTVHIPMRKWSCRSSVPFKIGTTEKNRANLVQSDGLCCASNCVTFLFKLNIF